MLVLFGMAVVPAMTAVHEQVQQWAQEQQRERQDAEEVGRMLGHEKEGDDAEESEEDQAGS
jgi:Cys-tRNA synthase (O-phospho-L-seryl-tRNA:Cys-tRNA synthase)